MTFGGTDRFLARQFHACFRWTIVALLSFAGLAGCEGGPTVSDSTIKGYPWNGVDAELSHACALAKGAAYCWGNNVHGQLGVVGQNTSAEPIKVNSGLRFTDIGVGNGYSCGLAEDGQIYCWGNNLWGQLGRVTESSGPYSTPMAIDGGRTYSALAVGYLFACGIAETPNSEMGAAFCWGRNTFGQIGTGESEGAGSFSTPQPVAGELVFSSISAGAHHACAITEDETAYCWGRNDLGQLGADPAVTATSAQPIKVSEVRSFKTISAGGYNSCGIAPSGFGFCWGSNKYGQLGNGEFGPFLLEHEPVGLDYPHPLSDIAVGFHFACAVRDPQISVQQSVFLCWGLNVDGQLGNSQPSELCDAVSAAPCMPSPMPVSAPSSRPDAMSLPNYNDQFDFSVTAGIRMACGLSHSLSSRHSALHCWGSGPLGDGSELDSEIPVRVAHPN